MQRLYLHNFKGFQNQYIQLSDVNFLVGENSTGKTTLINVINILSKQEFWLKGDFNIEDIQFGYFEEIISKNATSNTFFIGIEKTKYGYTRDENKKPIRVLLEFGERKSVPHLKSIKFKFEDITFKCTLNIRQPKAVFFQQATNESFEEWVVNDTKGKAVNIKLSFGGMPIILLMQLMISNAKEQLKLKFDTELFDALLYDNYTWLAPIRAKAKRIYESYNIKFSPEGEHIPSLLRKLLRDVKNRKRNIEILEKFGRDSHLFDTIEVKDFGSKDISPFEINIKYNDVPIKLPNVGYGVSQVLPLVIEMLASNSTLFSIQQPEVHLHPKAQAAFGSFLYKSCINEKHGFLVETHSDYTINRFRQCMNRETQSNDLSCQVLFFKRTLTGNEISRVGIGKEGAYQGILPEDYLEFFIDEELKSLEI